MIHLRRFLAGTGVVLGLISAFLGLLWLVDTFTQVIGWLLIITVWVICAYWIGFEITKPK